MSDESAKSRRFLLHLEPLQGSLEAYCRRNLNDPHGIEDALQSAIENAFRDFHLYAEGTNFRAWIFRYVNLEILNQNRKFEKTQHQSLPFDVSGDESFETGVSQLVLGSLLEAPDAVLEQCDDVLAQAVRELAPLERSALLLRAIGEFKYREIAEVLEIPIGSVMGYLARGRTKLRGRLAEYCRERGFLKGDA